MNAKIIFAKGPARATNDFSMNEHELKNLESFVSLSGAEFYGLPHNRENIILSKSDKKLEIPKKLQTSEGDITLFDPLMPIYWHIKN